MPIFEVNDNRLASVRQRNFEREKKLQILIESNLREVFNCRLVASEFDTGEVHAGRIDTLALSEEDNPVIIEYKKVRSSELVNQSLFYLYWLNDHRGTFEIAVQEELGPEAKVDWSDVRVLCLAPDYKRYDLHAVQVMGANIELWRYRLFDNDTLYLEEVLQRSLSAAASRTDGKDPKMVAAGKKAAQTRATASYTFEDRLEGKPEKMRTLAELVQAFMMDLDSAMEEVTRKFYVAYRISQNIVCMEVQHGKLLLHLKLNPGHIDPLPDNARDMRQTNHYGTGDLEMTVRSQEELEIAKPYIERAYQEVGG